MFGQTFALGDLGVVAFLVLLEALLSADNALVLAIMVRHLPKEDQKKALLYGLGGAFVFRLVAILLASYVIRLWWLQVIGALYLLALPVKHFLSHSQSKEVKEVKGGLWKTVVAVEVTDIAFAIDSVLAGVALVKSQDKIWVVYTGAIIGVVLLRFAAAIFIRLLDRYPVLDHVAYLLVGWVGVKLAFLAGHNAQRSLGTHEPIPIPEMPQAIFWAVLALIAIVGTILAAKSPKQPDETLDDCFEPDAEPS